MAFGAGSVANDQVDIVRCVIAALVEGENVLCVSVFRGEFSPRQRAAVSLFIEQGVEIFCCELIGRLLLHLSMKQNADRIGYSLRENLWYGEIEICAA